MNVYIKPAELVGAGIGDEISYHNCFGIVQTATIVAIAGNHSLRVKDSNGYMLNIPLHRLVSIIKEYKVGDRVERNDYEHLPVGTIVRDLDDLRVYRKDERGDWEMTGSEWNASNLSMSKTVHPREIVYLP